MLVHRHYFFYIEIVPCIIQKLDEENSMLLLNVSFCIRSLNLSIDFLIQKETLSKSIEFSSSSDGKTWEIDGENVQIRIIPVN